jgi:four helix bundle protein
MKEMTTDPPPPDLRERTTAFALRVVKLFGALPKSTEAQVLGKQLLRSGTSVGANYREAHRARSDAEFVSIIGNCLKELEESAYWLELLGAAEIIPAKRLASLQDEPSGARQTMRQHCPQGERGGAHQTSQLTAIFITISKKVKRRP